MDATTCKKELVIEVPVDVVQKEVDTVATQFAKRARIPGFRPGHAPASLVRRHFREDIRSEVVQTLVPRYFESALKEQKWKVVGEPRFEDLKAEDQQPLSCKATFEVYPDFELKDYRGLEVEEEEPVVTDADVEKALDGMREQAATFEVVSDRPAADDDYVTINYTGRDTQAPETSPVDSRDAVVHLGGKHTVEAFTEHLRGAKPGEVREFPVTYPADYPQKKLAGHTLSYRVDVQSIKRKVVPAADDELAKSVSEFASLEELRGKLREGLRADAQKRVELAAKQKLAERLLEVHQFPVPETLVEAQADRKLERTVTQLLAQGIDVRETEVDWRKVRDEGKGDAEKEVRVALLLSRIAEAEKIEVSEEEIDQDIRDLARDRRVTPAELKTRLTSDGKLDTLKSTHRNQKALDFIYRNAKIIRKNVPEPGPV